MFGRLLWGILRSSSSRLIVALLALTGGAAVVAALLTMQADIQQKLSGEFGTLGANLIIQPPRVLQTAGETGPVPASLLDASVIREVSAANIPGVPGAIVVPFLYAVAQANGRPIVVAGTWLDAAPRLSPWWKLIQGRWIASREDNAYCLLGRDAARSLGLGSGDPIHLQTSHASPQLTVAGVLEAGAEEDSQVIVSLPLAQQLAGAPGEISLVAVNVPGTTSQIEQARRHLAAALPQTEVRPVRQVTEAQGDMASRLRVLVASMVILILLLTLLCVLATMAALAVERRRDVGLMRALGGSISRVVALFLAEAGLLGAASGVLGYLIGVVLARWVGWRVFQALISPQWKVFPLTVAVMTGIALAGALPLRLLAKARPGAILRGES
jgi:putative ABC transport system permease protein